MSSPVTIKAGESTLNIRVEVNPNAYHGDNWNPEMYVARFRDASAIPSVGDVVTVIQPDDDPSADFVSTAVVADVDRARHLITLCVDWKGFHDVEPNRSPVLDESRTVTVSYRSEMLFASGF
ncbi:hypothetical protein ACJH6H_18505 [Mycobacterium sp. SMC-21]|jgi:hypothetical protein|uniref:hypothetical protein n=1 Tax=unclassified Mycobacterium TaxID=2642494 RepID=UPI0038769ABB